MPGGEGRGGEGKGGARDSPAIGGPALLGVRAGGGADWRRVRQDGNGSLSLEEFTLMIGRSPLRATLSDGKVARMYSELVSQEGIMTKRDWLSLFRYVEVRAAAIRLRGWRAACRLLRSLRVPT